MHPENARVAAVFGSAQGSGYLLTDRLILASGHVADEAADQLTAIVPGLARSAACEVIYRSSACDVVLLLAERALLGGPATVAGPDWAEISHLLAWPGARAVGYPQVQRGDAGELDAHQIVGRFNPGTGWLSRTAVLEDIDAPPGKSPWAGMSGALVFVEELVVGVVRADPSAWRHRRLTLTRVQDLLADPGFTGKCREAGYEIRTRALLSPGQGAAASFESRLRTYVATQSDRLWITGTVRNRFRREFGNDYWSLQDTYLSLHLSQALGEPQRAEHALAGKRRVVLVGGAGTGKTTLLQWLASAAARRALPPELAELNDRVPVLLQLRAFLKRKELPGPEEFLEAMASPLAGHPDAQGWMTRQLAAGRVLLMVDGLDEIPREFRDRTGRWLGDLIDAYGDNCYILSTRPSTVRAGWLDQRDFVELETQPMSTDEVTGLIERWFASVDVGMRRPSLEWIEHARQRALASVRENPDIARLATSPLLCTLLCALIMDAGSATPAPRSRAELYAGAVEMLLSTRDVGRDIGYRLGYSEQFHLLQRIAFWLSINGAVEVDTGQAVKLVRGVAESGPVRGEVSPSTVLQMLLIGSGMLQETSEGTIRFIHLPFQHYLTAAEALEDGSIGLLISHGHDEDWEDVLTLAAAQAREEDCAKLLLGLLARREKHPRQAEQLTRVARECFHQARALPREVAESLRSEFGDPSALVE